MIEINTDIVINATAEKVWSVLTEFERYPNWNPFILSIIGDKQEGKTLRVEIKPPEGTRMIFKPLILKFEPNREFRWLGKFFFKGIFDGEHYFLLKENENGETTFVQGERFSGLLAGMLGKTLEKTKLGFISMNQAIKAECEK